MTFEQFDDTSEPSELKALKPWDKRPEVDEETWTEKPVRRRLSVVLLAVVSLLIGSLTVLTPVGAADAAGSPCQAISDDNFEYKAASGTCDGDGILRGKVRDGKTSNGRCAYAVLSVRVQFLGTVGDAISYKAKECTEVLWDSFLINTGELQDAIGFAGWTIYICDGKVPRSENYSGGLDGDFSRCEKIESSYKSSI